MRVIHPLLPLLLTVQHPDGIPNAFKTSPLNIFKMPVFILRNLPFLKIYVRGTIILVFLASLSLTFNVVLDVNILTTANLIPVLAKTA